MHLSAPRGKVTRHSLDGSERTLSSGRPRPGNSVTGMVAGGAAGSRGSAPDVLRRASRGAPPRSGSFSTARSTRSWIVAGPEP